METLNVEMRSTIGGAEEHPPAIGRGRRGSRSSSAAALVLGAGFALCALSGMAADEGSTSDGSVPSTASLDDTREVMKRWIEQQQLISKERAEWQQGKEILSARVELLKKEIATLQEKISEAKTKVSASESEVSKAQTEDQVLAAAQAQLADAVEGMELKIREMFKSLPDPVQARVQQLYQRIPTETTTKAPVVAERFQNVLGILNEVNKSNNEISFSQEVRTLANGNPAEVRAIYIGLAQAYFVNSQGNEAGIGRPTPLGWTWESSKTIAHDVLNALDILQGKQSPAFVPLPVKIQ
jgi:hypothetical protein